MDAETQGKADQLIQAVEAQKETDIQAAVAAAVAPKDAEIAHLQATISQKDAETGQQVKEGQNQILLHIKSRLIRNQ